MSDVLIRSFRIRNALCRVFSYFCEGGALGSWATQNPHPSRAATKGGEYVPNVKDNLAKRT
jgi:hypothetical protein